MSNLQLQFRGDTAANWTAANPILASREMGIETDTHLFKIGDGVTTWNSLGYGGLQGPAGSTTTNTGTATINFGSAPGTIITTVTVTGQTGILSTSLVKLEMMGTDSTTDHNAYEHGIVPLVLRTTDISVGSSFTITASSDWRLTGTFKIRWTWFS